MAYTNVPHPEEAAKRLSRRTHGVNPVGATASEQAIIRPKRVRYIKLGQAGKWEKECLAKGIMRFGFGSAKLDRLELCRSGQWEKLAKAFIEEGRSKGTATHFTTENRLFFEDDGSIPWITFIGERLWWGFADPRPPEPHHDGDGVWRLIVWGWRSTDLNSEPLTKDRLSGALTKLAGYRATSCDVDVAAYVVRRINGQKAPEVERAIALVDDMKTSVCELLKFLEPRDFELLVDLVFSNSGWRRLGIVGKTQKTLDLDLLLPSTGERAFVQVKSNTTSAELAEYLAALDDSIHDRMFYVFHSGEAATDDDRVTVIGPEGLAGLVIDAGLVNWLIRKVS